MLKSGTNELEIIEFFIKTGEKNSTDNNIKSTSYGINVGKVREIIRTPENITEVAKTHPSLEGIYNFRGRIIPIVNLPGWLGKKVKDLTLNRIIITEFNRNQYGFLVMSVSKIHRISWEDVEPPGTLIAGGENECVTGIVKFDDRILIMLDFEKIIMDVNPATVQLMAEVNKIKRKKQGKTIMVVEDSKTVTKIIRTILQNSGYAVVTAANGEDAYGKLSKLILISEERNQSCTEYLQAIISDVEMPRMDGLHFLVKVQEHVELKNIPVILFSSMTTPENIKKWDQLGAVDLISKMQIHKLLESVDKHIL